MGIENAIKFIDMRLEEIEKGEMRDFENIIKKTLTLVNIVLKEEAKPPCERCKHWKLYDLTGMDCIKFECVHSTRVEDLFEPKEK